MQVDQPRRYQLATGVHYPERAVCGDCRSNRLDQAIADADIAFTRQPLAGVEHVGVSNQKVELVVRTHGRDCGTREHTQGAERQACLE